MVRAGSALRPETLALRDAGVEIRIGDLEDDLEQHIVTLQGVDLLISAVSAFALDKQRTIIRAAKEVGVGRVIPCDWGTPGAKGVRELHDQVSKPRHFKQRYLSMRLTMSERFLTTDRNSPFASSSRK